MVPWGKLETRGVSALEGRQAGPRQGAVWDEQGRNMPSHSLQQRSYCHGAGWAAWIPEVPGCHAPAPSVWASSVLSPVLLPVLGDRQLAGPAGSLRWALPPESRPPACSCSNPGLAFLRELHSALPRQAGCGVTGLVTSTFSRCLLAKTDAQKKVSSVLNCCRLPLIPNWAAGPVTVCWQPEGGGQYLKSRPSHVFLRQFLLRVPSMSLFRKAFPRTSNKSGCILGSLCGADPGTSEMR